MLNAITQPALLCFLLGSSFYFGYLAKPTEMGLSILAGAISLAFANIDKISKFKGAGFEAEMRETQETVEALVAKDAEPSAEPVSSSTSDKMLLLGRDATEVVKCLANSKYSWRTIDGISKESSLSIYSVTAALLQLSMLGLAVRMGGKQVYWGLTERGRELFSSISNIPTEQ